MKFTIKTKLILNLIDDIFLLIINYKIIYRFKNIKDSFVVANYTVESLRKFNFFLI
jgi:hypothetical protein